MKECVDITKQYLNDASPGSGEIIKQEGYIDSLHNKRNIYCKMADKYVGRRCCIIEREKPRQRENAGFLVA